MTTRFRILQAAEKTAAAEGWRVDKRTQWAALWDVMTRWARWTTGLITVTRAQIAKAVTEITGRPMSVSTVTRYWADAVKAGWLHEIERGASHTALRTGRNRAATMLVTLPVAQSAHPSLDRPPVSLVPRGKSSVEATRTEREKLRDEQAKTLHTKATTHRARIAATEALKARCGWKNLPTVRLARALRPWFQAGCTAYDVLHAIDHRPDGGRHTGPVDHQARNVIGIVCWRLELWSEAGLRPGQVATPVAEVVEPVSVPAGEDVRRGAMVAIRAALGGSRRAIQKSR